MGIVVGGFFVDGVPQVQIDFIDDVEVIHDGFGATVGIRFNDDGTYDVDEGFGFTFAGNWLASGAGTPDIGDAFEIFMDDTTGAWDGGDSVDAWLGIDGNRVWTDISFSDESVTFTATIREIANTSNSDSQAGVVFSITQEA